MHLTPIAQAAHNERAALIRSYDHLRAVQRQYGEPSREVADARATCNAIGDRVDALEAQRDALCADAV